MTVNVSDGELVSVNIVSLAGKGVSPIVEMNEVNCSPKCKYIAASKIDVSSGCSR